MEIQRNGKIKEKTKYYAKWNELRGAGAAAVAAAAAPVTLDEDLPLGELLQRRAGLDLRKKRRLLLEDLVLANADGDALETAKIVLQLQ